TGVVQGIEAGRPVTDGAHGEREAEKRERLALAGEVGQTRGDRRISGGEHLGGDEVLDRCGGHRDTSRPSRRSDRASTSEVGGRQEKTPYGAPAWRGVSGPTMPRRYR